MPLPPAKIEYHCVLFFGSPEGPNEFSMTCAVAFEASDSSSKSPVQLAFIPR